MFVDEQERVDEQEWVDEQKRVDEQERVEKKHFAYDSGVTRPDEQRVEKVRVHSSW